MGQKQNRRVKGHHVWQFAKRNCRYTVERFVVKLPRGRMESDMILLGDDFLLTYEIMEDSFVPVEVVMEPLLDMFQCLKYDPRRRMDIEVKGESLWPDEILEEIKQFAKNLLIALVVGGDGFELHNFYGWSRPRVPGVNHDW